MKRKERRRKKRKRKAPCAGNSIAISLKIIYSKIHPSSYPKNVCPYIDFIAAEL
jgi:hypothetical protein